MLKTILKEMIAITIVLYFFAGSAYAQECGGSLENSGVIQSPNYPSFFPSNSVCTWNLTATRITPLNQSHAGSNEASTACITLQLQIVSFDLGREGSYLEIYQSNLLIANFTGSVPMRKIQLGGRGRLVFSSAASGSGRGFEMTFSTVGCMDVIRGNGTVVSPSYPFRYPGNAFHYWHLVAPEGQKLLLRIRSFNLENGTDTLELYENEVRTARLSGSLDQNAYVIEGLAELIFLSAITSEGTGFLIDVEPVGCGGSLVASGDISTPNYPNSYLATKPCKWTLNATMGRVIQLDFVTFDLRSRGLQLQIYWPSDGFTYNYSGRLDQHLVLMGGYGELTLTNVAGINAGRMWIQFKSIECGGEIVDRGEIRSPNYPYQYPDRSSCLWNLRASTGRVLLLDFDEVGLHPRMDSLAILDENSEYLGSYATRARNHRKVSVGNRATIRFSTDIGGRGIGFSVKITSAVCRANLTGSGTIASPDWPEEYPADLLCCWFLTATPGRRVMLDIETLELPSFYDTLSIQDGENATYTYTQTRERHTLLLGQEGRIDFRSASFSGAGKFLITFTSS